MTFSVSAAGRGMEDTRGECGLSLKALSIERSHSKGEDVSILLLHTAANTGAFTLN